VLYGIKNGVRDFIYNSGANTTKYATGTTGILAFASNALTNAMIASWSTGPAPVSSGTWDSSIFAGTENPLDEGDRWYPLPTYSGFRKTGGAIIGLNSAHNAAGVWSIAPPVTQYSQVTLGAVVSGAGGPIVRIDRSNAGQTGWLLFLYADNPSASGIYKMTPDGGFAAVRFFTPTIVSGDTWRLTADGNTLEIFQNGVLQFTYTTDGSYPTGDVGIETYTPAFTFKGWEGGSTAGPPTDTQAPTAPSNVTSTAVSSSQINLAWTGSTDNVGVTAYMVERCQGSGCTGFAQVGTVAGTTYSDTGLTAQASYSYRVRAADAAGNLSPYSNVTSATTLAVPDTSPPTAPGALTAIAVNGRQINLMWTAATDNVGVTGYLVERCQGVSCNAFAQVVTASGTTYNDTSVVPNTSYSYRVRATDAAGNVGPYSNVASATTLPF
jgi:chitodextrinase